MERDQTGMTSWSRIHLTVYLSAPSDLASGGPGTRIWAKNLPFHGWGYVSHPLSARFSRFVTAPDRPADTVAVPVLVRRRECAGTGRVGRFPMVRPGADIRFR